MLCKVLISVFLTYLNPPNSYLCHHDIFCYDWARILSYLLYKLLKNNFYWEKKERVYLNGQIIINVVWRSSSVFFFFFFEFSHFTSFFSIHISYNYFEIWYKTKLKTKLIYNGIIFLVITYMTTKFWGLNGCFTFQYNTIYGLKIFLNKSWCSIVIHKGYMYLSIYLFFFLNVEELK